MQLQYADESVALAEHLYASQEIALRASLILIIHGPIIIDTVLTCMHSIRYLRHRGCTHTRHSLRCLTSTRLLAHRRVRTIIDTARMSGASVTSQRGAFYMREML